MIERCAEMGVIKGSTTDWNYSTESVPGTQMAETSRKQCQENYMVRVF